MATIKKQSGLQQRVATVSLSCLSLLLTCLLILRCQHQPQHSDLRKNFGRAGEFKGQCLAPYDTGDSLDYVRLLGCSWKLINTDTSVFAERSYLQGLSYVGDMQNILRFSRNQRQKKLLETDSEVVNEFRKHPLHYLSARQTIIDRFKNASIIMFNEAHDRPQTRAFVVSMLADLKKCGATHLAMETLSDEVDQKELTSKTGWYTQEPVSGQIVREAIALGYKLVPYEDRTHSSNRDSVMAANLISRISNESGINKTVVVAGYGHISETPIKGMPMMALSFRKQSGIDPLTVEQTNLLEEYPGNPGFNSWLHTISNADTIFAIGKDMWRLAADTNSNDLVIYHPATRFIHGRPNWLLCFPESRFFEVKLPSDIKPVLVQAYLSNEIKSPADYFFRIPVDQTFYSEDGSVWLALRNEHSYRIVFRDKDNRILLARDTTVHW